MLPKVQHYVPRFLLRRFANAEDDNVYVFDKWEELEFPARPKRIAAVNAFYDLKIPEGVITLEPALADLETKVAEITDSIVQEESLAHLGEEERHTLAVFVAAQHMRTEHFRRNIADMDEQLSSRLKDMGIDPHQVANYRPFQGDEEVKAFSLRMLVSSTALIAATIEEKDWMLVRSSKETPFMIGDNPVAMHNERKSGFYGSHGFMVPGIEIYMPIDPDYSLYFVCKSNGDAIRDSWRKLSELRSYLPPNAKVLQHEERLATLHDALEHQEALHMTSDNLLHHNSLQVRNAGRWVFSRTGDFGLVRRMIDENPAIKKGPFGKVGP